MITCPGCGLSIEPRDQTPPRSCPGCGEPLTAAIDRPDAEDRKAAGFAEDQTFPPESGQSADGSQPSSQSGAVGVLRAIGWVNLCAGVLLALILWAKASGEGASSAEDDVVIGIALLLSGIVSCTYILVVCEIASAAKDIRGLLQTLVLATGKVSAKKD
ncbi:MAG TPA: hypothetical protein VI756_11780 [Blastocatellia bacterium]